RGGHPPRPRPRRSPESHRPHPAHVLMMILTGRADERRIRAIHALTRHTRRTRPSFLDPDHDQSAPERAACAGLVILARAAREAPATPGDPGLSQAPGADWNSGGWGCVVSHRRCVWVPRAVTIAFAEYRSAGTALRRSP